jgi:hypothetical protein
MTPTLNLEGVKKTKPSEYVLRFVFGGAVTVATGLVAHFFGPGIGGLFLAFPAILPATLTLVDRHGARDEVVDEARGACLGTLGLAAFALATWDRAPSAHPAVVLAIATITWAVVGGAAWWTWYGRESPRGQSGPPMASS